MPKPTDKEEVINDLYAFMCDYFADGCSGGSITDVHMLLPDEDGMLIIREADGVAKVWKLKAEALELIEEVKIGQSDLR
jgi:hypothetical protein